MKILFMDWYSYGNEDIIAEFQNQGYIVDLFKFPQNSEDTRHNPALSEKIIRTLAADKYEYVFSFNYFPVVSIACNAAYVKYISWVYDSPFMQLYSNTIRFPYNFVFIFDKAVYLDLKSKKVNTVYYLPMAAPVSRYDTYYPSAAQRKKYSGDISFVGATYHEKKNQWFERLEGLDEYTKGYLEGIMQAQKRIYGYNFLEELLTPNITKKLQESCLIEEAQDGFETPSWIYANYFLARRVTAMERFEILDMISEQHQINLYTREETHQLAKVHNKGIVEYYSESPYVFKCSKINLNITLRSIISGIPLRAMDIMGCGGFLLTNYQEDFLEFFEPDVDFVFYHDYQDLMDKIDFYLAHDQEREKIAKSGYLKVKENHTYQKRISQIFDTIQRNI